MRGDLAHDSRSRVRVHTISSTSISLHSSASYLLATQSFLQKNPFTEAWLIWDRSGWQSCEMSQLLIRPKAMITQDQLATHSGTVFDIILSRGLLQYFDKGVAPTEMILMIPSVQRRSTFSILRSMQSASSWLISTNLLLRPYMGAVFSEEYNCSPMGCAAGRS